MYYSESQTDVSQKQEWQQHKKNMFGLFYCLLNFEFSSSSGIAVLPNPPPSHCVCRLDVYAILFYSVLFEDIVIIVEDDGPLSSTIRRINIIFSIKIFWQESFFFLRFPFFLFVAHLMLSLCIFFSSCARCWLLWTLLLAICYFFCQIKFRSGRSGCGKEWVSFCEKLASWAVLNATRPFFICFCCFCCCCCGHCSWMSSYSTS